MNLPGIQPDAILIQEEPAELLSVIESLGTTRAEGKEGRKEEGRKFFSLLPGPCLDTYIHYYYFQFNLKLDTAGRGGSCFGCYCVVVFHSKIPWQLTLWSCGEATDATTKYKDLKKEKACGPP